MSAGLPEYRLSRVRYLYARGKIQHVGRSGDAPPSDILKAVKLAFYT